MYIVVIGLGEVGRHLLSVLDREGHDVVAVDSDPQSVKYAEDHFDVMSLVGYGASHETLKKARVHEADLVAAVTNHDEVNLIAALAAKQLGTKRVIARAQGNEWAKWTEGVRYGLLGVDVVINPRVLVAQEISRIARSHGACDVIDLAQDRVELVQMDITENTRLLNKPLAKLDLPRKTLVAAVVREGELFVPGGADVLLQGDRVYLIGRPADLVRAEDMFTTRREASRVCIVGGGVIGQSIARSLSDQGCKVLVIERNEQQAQELSAELPSVTVVHGDGTDLALLEEEEAGTYDLLCAVTSQDEVNLMAALLAQRVGVSRTAAVVQRAAYLPIYRQLGVDIVLSPRTVASDHILRYSHTEAVQNLTMLEGGKAEVVEMQAARHSSVIGVPLRRLTFPRGSLLAAIVHKDEVIVPRGDDKVRAGDTVIIVTTHEAMPAIERMFRPREL